MRRAVHPHPRGEYNLKHRNIVRRFGSSPPAWGIHPTGRAKRRRGRFIPTRVGNTAVSPSSHIRHPVHPHPRGEYGGREGGTAANTVHPHPRGDTRPPPWNDNSAAGSSPPAWGIQFHCAPRFEQSRFIPTRVGNTFRCFNDSYLSAVHPHPRGDTAIFGCFMSGCPVHPHPRGEYALPNLVPVGIDGSSPPAWGILSHNGQRSNAGRFIPTRVGNTLCALLVIVAVPVHPHPRGEYFCIACAISLTAGSSPPAWGILQVSDKTIWRMRFIPTRVGNTPSPRRCMGNISVHPHPRGEYLEPPWAERWDYGSSPPAWGILPPFSFRQPPNRFIPTRVGNTDLSGHQPSVLPVHPHPRGEYGGSGSPSGEVAGSSPPAWGILIDVKFVHDFIRFIPTRVGNTPRFRRLLQSRTVHPHPRGEYCCGRVVPVHRHGSSPPAWGYAPLPKNGS